jgi:acyl-CoA thioester hydrolase
VSRAPLRGRAAYRVWRDVTTRWGDNDLYGHVNNVVHYAWIDTAVNAWLIEQGLLDLEEGDPIGLVVETGCRYARPLAYPQDIDIGLAVESIGRSSVRYALGIFGQGEKEAAAEGFLVHVYVGRASRAPTDIPTEWKNQLEEIRLVL